MEIPCGYIGYHRNSGGLNKMEIRDLTTSPSTYRFKIKKKIFQNDVTTCEYDGKQYLIGERIYTNSNRASKEDECKICLCSQGFNGTLVEPWCRKYSCDIYLLYLSYIKGGCIPTYYHPDDCCPVPIFRCHSESMRSHWRLRLPMSALRSPLQWRLLDGSMILEQNCARTRRMACGISSVNSVLAVHLSARMISSWSLILSKIQCRRRNATPLVDSILWYRVLYRKWYSDWLLGSHTLGTAP
ncbi:unnamed protein product, partial [Nesidiocoris tenuis]